MQRHRVNSLQLSFTTDVIVKLNVIAYFCFKIDAASLRTSAANKHTFSRVFLSSS